MYNVVGSSVRGVQISEKKVPRATPLGVAMRARMASKVEPINPHILEKMYSSIMCRFPLTPKTPFQSGWSTENVGKSSVKQICLSQSN
jgi:hypothetical protein